MSQSSTLKSNPEACRYASKCGGCQLQNMTYGRQLQWKQNRVGMLLGRYGKPEPIVSMEDPYHYRNKVQAAFGRTRSGKVVSGVYQSGSHRIVPVDSCQIEDETADAIIRDIRKLLQGFRIRVYDEDTGTGFLRHVLVRRGFVSGQVMVVLVGTSFVFPMKKAFVRTLLDMHPEITTLVLNVNTKNTNLVLGDREEALYGPGWIEDTLCGLIFRISPRSFYQINPVQTEKLYALAIECAGLNEDCTVLDAYCGIGTIGLAAASQVKRVVGVELNRSAVRDAIANAKRNGIENARFYSGDAGEFMQAMAESGEKADVVFMDPPRAGSTERFIESVAAMGPKRVVYISCNPETQARDLESFERKGYKVGKICPVDMFPHTNHVETVVCLSNKNAKPKDYVEIGVDAEDYYRIKDSGKK